MAAVETPGKARVPHAVMPVSVTYRDVDSFCSNLGQVVDLVFGDDIGRHEVDHVPQGAQQRLTGKGMLVHPDASALLPGEGLPGFTILDHFDGQGHASLAD